MKWINKKEFGKFSVEEYTEDEIIVEKQQNENEKKKEKENNKKILLLRMNDNENRFNPINLKYINQALDYIESIDDCCCLITTGTNESKYYSLGLDLEWVKPRGKSSFFNLLYDLSVLLERILMFPIPTISCINGHSYAGGAIFSLAHDFRVMNDNKGFICVNAIDNNIPLPPGLIDTMKCKINNPCLYRDFVLMGKRYGGLDAEKLQLVDKTSNPSTILEESIKLAKDIGYKDRLTFSCLKIESYKLISQSLLNKDLGQALKLKIFD
ncbi:hypothetical protein RB653_008720 [Dictyostelium firmibasis]|uniref:Enoyl-CoA hydratase/isomerase family protein n=1 Tax=Dictyostelium firmibasis TaxID=79012 RepID=A0AAN7TZM8_9MYCE